MEANRLQHLYGKHARSHYTNTDRFLRFDTRQNAYNWFAEDKRNIMAMDLPGKGKAKMTPDDNDMFDSFYRDGINFVMINQ